MNPTKRGIVSVVVLCAVLGPASAASGDAAAEPDLATVLARHVEARGGAERWAAVETMTVTGTWEAFSTPGPFTVHRAAPDRWRFEHTLFGQPAILAHDGEHAWIQGAALGVPEPARLDQPWRRNLIEDAAFRTPLLTGSTEGTSLELVGRGEVEGTGAWVVRVTREGRPEETWYLDATTYLELKRESTTFDVFSGGIEIPMETFYDDFREVDGLVLPFHEERHFGTRYHVTDLETVEVDPALPDALFEAPPPPAPPEEDAGSEASAGGTSEGP
jgi:hypothetical protein